MADNPQSSRPWGKKPLVLYLLSILLFVPIAMEYLGEESVPRSTKVAFFALAAGIVAGGIRLVVELMKRRKDKESPKKGADQKGQAL